MFLILVTTAFFFLISVQINAVPVSSVSNNGATNVIFRPGSTGFFCGDAPFTSIPIGYSMDSRTPLTTLVANITSQCRTKCANMAQCRAFSLSQLPISGNNNQLSLARCNVFESVDCNVFGWPSPSSTGLFHKIEEIAGYGLVEYKCRRDLKVVERGPPAMCQQMCDYTPKCIGFNYQFSTDLCFILENPSFRSERVSLRMSTLSYAQAACGSSLLQQDSMHVFFVKKHEPSNGLFDQPYPGFFLHNGNCRGGVSSSFQPIGARPPVAIHTCPTCNTTIGSCLQSCRSLDWCKGVSAFPGATFDYSKPICFLKPMKCPVSAIEPNTVYRFFEKVDS